MRPRRSVDDSRGHCPRPHGRQSWRWEGPTRPHSAAHFSALERWAVPCGPGRLLRIGETAIIGHDADGPYVRERFRAGSLAMPPEYDVPVLVNW